MVVGVPHDFAGSGRLDWQPIRPNAVADRNMFTPPPGVQARRVVFVVDASGSLIDTLAFVIRDLKRAVGSLNERQMFTVIFFQGSYQVSVVK